MPEQDQGTCSNTVCVFVCVCVCIKPQARIRLVRGKIRRTHEGLPWCNIGSCSEAWKHHAVLQAKLTPEPLSATSWTSLSLSPTRFLPRTHRFSHTGSSQMACPLLHIAVGQVLFLSLTVWLSLTKPRRIPIAWGRTHTCTKHKSSALRPQASSPASVRAMLSLWGDTMPLHPPQRYKHTHSLQLHTHTHTRTH